jgi:hypothetical protein
MGILIAWALVRWQNMAVPQRQNCYNHKTQDQQKFHCVKIKVHETDIGT